MWLRSIAIVYAIVTLIYAFYASATQTQPALFFIDLFANIFYNQYPVFLVAILTVFVFRAPLFGIIYIVDHFQGPINHMPDDMIGKVGIMVHRPYSLANGLYNYTLLLNGILASRVSNDKKTFIEINQPGIYTLQIKGYPQTICDVLLEDKIVYFRILTIDDGGLSIKVRLEKTDSL